MNVIVRAKAGGPAGGTEGAPGRGKLRAIEQSSINILVSRKPGDPKIFQIFF